MIPKLGYRGGPQNTAENMPRVPRDRLGFRRGVGLARQRLSGCGSVLTTPPSQFTSWWLMEPTWINPEDSV